LLGRFGVEGVGVAEGAAAVGELFEPSGAAGDVATAVESTMLTRSTLTTAITPPIKSPLLTQRPDAFIVGPVQWPALPTSQGPAESRIYTLTKSSEGTLARRFLVRETGAGYTHNGVDRRIGIPSRATDRSDARTTRTTPSVTGRRAD
jgi:hypothetical protein